TNNEIKVVDGNGTSRQGFLRFNVSGLPTGATIMSAQLELFVTNGSDSGGIFWRTTNTRRPEAITWNTKPAIDAPRSRAAAREYRERRSQVGDRGQWCLQLRDRLAGWRDQWFGLCIARKHARRSCPSARDSGADERAADHYANPQR